MKKIKTLYVVIFTLVLVFIEAAVMVFPSIPPFPIHMLTYKYNIADKTLSDEVETKYIYSGLDREMKEMKNILLSSVPDTVDKRNFESAKDILKYILDYASFSKSEIKSRTPLGKFKETKSGKSGLCFDFNHIYHGFLKAAGYRSRILILQSNLMLLYGRVHTNVEVFIPEYNKWVVIDPSYGCYFSLDNIPMSSIEINQLLQSSLERINDININYIEHNGNLPKWNKSAFLIYNNIILIEKYTLPVIKYESLLSDLKNISISSTNVYIYSDRKGQKQNNLLYVLNTGHVLIKIVIPLFIVFNCIYLCVVYMKKPRKTNKR